MGSITLSIDLILYIAGALITGVATGAAMYWRLRNRVEKHELATANAFELAYSKLLAKKDYQTYSNGMRKEIADGVREMTETFTTLDKRLTELELLNKFKRNNER